MPPNNDELMPCPLENLRSTFGERIRFLRENAGQSLQDVASAIGIAKSHMHDMEHGKSNNPSINIIRGLAIHFMVPVAALVETEITAQYRATPPPSGDAMHEPHIKLPINYTCQSGDAVRLATEALRLVDRGFQNGKLKDCVICLTDKPGPTLETTTVSKIVLEALAALYIATTPTPAPDDVQ